MKNLDRSDIIALIAVVMSLAAVFVSIYEARLLKDQQKLMHEQQKAAVWPYVKKSINYSYQPDEMIISLTKQWSGSSNNKKI